MNTVSMPPNERVREFFERLAILELTDEQKQEIAVSIQDHLKPDFPYWSQVCLSSVIATFGLIQNSGAVVIGAMLIAPLLLPIKGMAFGIATGYGKVFWRAATMLAKSVGVSIAIAWFMTAIIPFHEETAEILARTTPNLIDLLIAIASAIIALLALYFKELSASIGGVAMATALMPPIAVVGIEIALGNINRSWGAFFLFITNLFAIVLVGTIMFFLYGFSPHQETSQKNTLRQLGVLLTLGLLIIFPLASSLLDISEAVTLQARAQVYVNETLDEVIPQAQLSRIELVEHSGNTAHFRGTIQLPEGTDFFEEAREAIRANLSDKLDRDIQLDLQVIRSVSILPRERNISSLAQNLRDNLRELVTLKVPEVSVVRIDASELRQEQSPQQAVQILPRWTLNIIVASPPDFGVPEERKEEIEQAMRERFAWMNINFFWTFLPTQSQKKAIAEEKTQRELWHTELTLEWENFFATTLPQAQIENLRVTWQDKEGTNNETFTQENIERYQLAFDIFLPVGKQRTPWWLREQVKRYAEDVFNKPVDVEFRVFTFQDVRSSVEKPEE